MNAVLSTPSAEAAAILVSAFRTDPAARWIYPDERQFETFFPHFVEAFAGAAFVHDTAFLEKGATALWLPPGVGPEEVALGALIEKSVPEERHAEVFALFDAMGMHHPVEPHWYLPMIGVEPDLQGRGRGAGLMRAALERCDQAGLPAYLESTNPRNVSFYERFGFRVTGEIRAGSCPTILSMWREAP